MFLNTLIKSSSGLALLVCLLSACTADVSSDFDFSRKKDVIITTEMSTRTHLAGDSAVWSDEADTAFAVVQTYGYLYMPVNSSAFRLEGEEHRYPSSRGSVASGGHL